jgi:hypothetical protein
MLHLAGVVGPSTCVIKTFFVRRYGGSRPTSDERVAWHATQGTGENGAVPTYLGRAAVHLWTKHTPSHHRSTPPHSAAGRFRNGLGLVDMTLIVAAPSLCQPAHRYFCRRWHPAVVHFIRRTVPILETVNNLAHGHPKWQMQHESEFRTRIAASLPLAAPSRGTFQVRPKPSLPLHSSAGKFRAGDACVCLCMDTEVPSHIGPTHRVARCRPIS